MKALRGRSNPLSGLGAGGEHGPAAPLLTGPALPGGLGTLRAGRPPQSSDALPHPPPRGPSLGCQRSRSGEGPQDCAWGTGPAWGWRGRDGERGASTGSPRGPLCPDGLWVPAPQTPSPTPAGSQNLLQVQVPGEVECASLRLMEVPRDVAVAGKRVTGVRPPVVLHSVSQTSTSVPKTLMTAEDGFLRYAV